MSNDIKAHHKLSEGENKVRQWPKVRSLRRRLSRGEVALFITNKRRPLDMATWTNKKYKIVLKLKLKEVKWYGIIHNQQDRDVGWGLVSESFFWWSGGNFDDYVFRGSSTQKIVAERIKAFRKRTREWKMNKL